MDFLFKLQNSIKHYDWGSPEWIPKLLGKDNTEGFPWAELWMGIHPEGPSVIADRGETLASLLDRHPEYLGGETQQSFGTLPYLFKLLAAEKSLSIQAHPNLEQAKEGWESENRRGIPLTGPNRNYRDPNHKPEILCALSPFKALCGFRPLPEIAALLRLFSGGALPPLKGALSALLSSPAGPDPAASGNLLREFLKTLFNLSPENRRALGVYAREARPRLIRDHGEYRELWECCAAFAELYPEDPAVISPLYLNLINLAAGEAIYLPAGVLHAYIRGFGVELMANSDNVLRGGLTSKYVDIDELLKILRFSPGKPEILRRQGVQSTTGGNSACSCFKYQTPCREFSLSFMESQNGRGSIPEKGPLILIVTDGQAAVREEGGGKEIILKRGEAAFIPARDASPPLSLAGTFTLYAAGPGTAPEVPAGISPR
ncbi:MAG: mannose-6-phosphate isomerase, class I [Treponema sp.]|jgi:mannose-6-phosphate isomerase|nr:mannose-6-phosphate isomerase, class I [Treponema sp.]